MTASVWSDVAAGWERWRDHLDAAYRPVRSWLLAELGLRDGETLLDVAAGTGSAGFDALAELAGRDGRASLVATDLSAAMLAAAGRRRDELALRDEPALGDVLVAVGDAQALPLRDGTVDRVLCESGIGFVPDPARALREIRRVLRPGGRVALSGWGPDVDNPWHVLGPALLVEAGHLAAPEDTGAATADAEVLPVLLAEAGFGSVRTATVPVVFAYTGIDEWERWSVDTMTTGPVLAALDAGARRAYRDAVTAALAPYRAGDGFAVPGSAWVCAATAT